MRLNAVSLGVSDIARSTSFYELLGWRRSSISTSKMAVLAGQASAILILHELRELVASANVAAEAESGFGGVALVMFVDSPEDVHRTLARASSAGARTLRSVTQLGYGSHAYFSDHDGHVWEVIEAPGFAIDERGEVSLP